MAKIAPGKQAHALVEGEETCDCRSTSEKGTRMALRENERGEGGIMHMRRGKLAIRKANIGLI